MIDSLSVMVDPQPILAFPGLDFLEDIVTGAAGAVADDIIATISGWILSSAFAVFGFAIDIAFSNDGVVANCELPADVPEVAEGAQADEEMQCQGAAFVRESFQRSLAASGGLALIALIYTVMKTVISGDPGLIARRALLDAPKIMLLSVFFLQFTVLVILATDEVAAALTHPAIGPARDQYLGSFTTEEFLNNPQGVQNASFVVTILGVLLIIGSVFLWMLMMLRAVVIPILIVLAPLVAALAIGNGGESLNRLMKLLFAVITSKIVVIVTLSLGIAAMLQVPFIAAGLNPEAVVPAAPGLPGEAVEIPEIPADEALAAGFEVAYQLATGALLVLAATFSPVLILQLLPDSLEQFYAFGNADNLLRNSRSRFRAAPVRAINRLKAR